LAVSDKTIDAIKALPITEVLAGEGVLVKKVGREGVCHCVWHEDTNPSLTISDQKGFLFCHVCRASGDAISYIKEKFGLSFREAVERIAANNSIQVIYVDENSEELEKRRVEREAAYEAVDKKQQQFREQLNLSKRAKDFIKSRSIEPKTSREFGLGYDKRRNRLTIPIHNASGRLVGFTGRSIGGEKPKYVNTENNVIFNKSNIVFNEYRALQSIREAGECVFVEGHVDVIALHQYGIHNVVALQGTASPDEAVLNRLVKRTKRFVLCMDGDEGGRQAIGKFLNATESLSLSGKLDVKVVTLPDGKDPDDCIKNGIDMRSLIANAQNWIDWILDKWLDSLDFSDTVKINEVEKRIKQLLGRISSQSLRTHYFDKAALRLAQNKQNLAFKIAKGFHESTGYTPKVKAWEKPDALKTRKSVERRLLRLYIHNPSYRFMLEPMMDRLYYPEMIWLWSRIKEAEMYANEDNLSLVVMAMLLVAEPQFLQQLRPLLVPTISVSDNPNIVAHIETTMMQQIEEKES